jgi:WD40 repeat protein
LIVKKFTFKIYKNEMSKRIPNGPEGGVKKPILYIRKRLMSLHLANIQMGQLSGRVRINDMKQLRAMLIDTYRMKWKTFLMKGKLFSMLVERLISMPRQSTASEVPVFRSPWIQARRIVSCQNPVFQRFLGTFDSSTTVHDREIKAVAVNSKADSMAVLMNFDTVKLLCTHQGSIRCRAHLGHYEAVSVAIHPSGTLVATGGRDNKVKLWRKNLSNDSWNCTQILGGHTDDVTSLAFHQSLPLLVSGSNDGNAKVWLINAEISSAHCVTTLSGHRKDINAVAFHRSLPVVASASDDKTVKIWLLSPDFSSNKELMTLTGHSNYVTAVDFHPTLPLLATASRDCSVKVYLLSPDCSFAECIATLTEHRERVLALAFHESAPILATCGWDKPVKVWVISSDYSSVSCVANLLGHTGPITSVKFNRDCLITCSSDRTLKFW